MQELPCILGGSRYRAYIPVVYFSNVTIFNRLGQYFSTTSTSGMRPIIEVVKRCLPSSDQWLHTKYHVSGKCYHYLEAKFLEKYYIFNKMDTVEPPLPITLSGSGPIGWISSFHSSISR